MQKSKNVLQVCLILAFLLTGVIKAQNNLKLEHLVKNGEQIELTLSSSKSFYIGAQGYTLFIDQTPISKYQTRIKKDTQQILITFFISTQEYTKLADNSAMTLVYGNSLPEPVSSKAKKTSGTITKSNGHWQLPRLNKGKLKAQKR